MDILGVLYLVLSIAVGLLLLVLLVVLHELGHAIGLDHTNAVSVMQPAGSFYTIQPDDVQAVQKLYANNK